MVQNAQKKERGHYSKGMTERHSVSFSDVVPPEIKAKYPPDIQEKKDRRQSE